MVVLEHLKKVVANSKRKFLGFGEGRSQSPKKPLSPSILPNGGNIFSDALGTRGEMKHQKSKIQNLTSQPDNDRCRRVRHWTGRGHITLLLALFAVAFGRPNLQAQVSREYQLKAVFLYNFAQFTEWPDSAFAGPNSPFVVGILGADPFGSFLADTVKGESMQGHPFVIEHYRRAEDIKACHILFISQSEDRQLEEIVRSLKGKPILTVADSDGRASAGVIIRFVVENNKVHFRIDEQAAIQAHLLLSSRLLRVGEAAPPGRRP